MDLFPCMLYRLGGPHDIHGGKFDTLIVADEHEQDAALAAAWYLTTDSAREAASLPPPDDAPPTRAELEAKATELGITFDGRTNDAKLAAKINHALKA